MTILPPANEVWYKVMFLHLSVSHSVHGGGRCGEGGYGERCVCVLKGDVCDRHPGPRGRPTILGRDGH